MTQQDTQPPAETRDRLTDYEQMQDAQKQCVPCALCGGKAVISDAGTGMGYYINCSNYSSFQSSRGCIIDQQRLGGWAYNVMDWWNRLHTAALTRRAGGEVEGLPLSEVIADADRLADAVDHGRRTDASSIVDTLRRLAKVARRSGGDAGAREALERALDANVPVGQIDARVRDTIIANVLGRYDAALALPAPVVEGDAADARRYRYLRDHCSYHQSMTWQQPAEWSIGWEFQQVTPDQAFGSFDRWIDEDIERQLLADSEDTEDADAPAALSEGRSHG